MLLSFSMGTAPWVYMAQKETQGGGGEGSIITTFFMQISFVAVMLAIVVFRPSSLLPLWLIFGAIMLIGVCASVAYGLASIQFRTAYELARQD